MVEENTQSTEQTSSESAPLGEQKQEIVTPAHVEVADQIEANEAEENIIDTLVDEMLDEDGVDASDEAEGDAEDDSLESDEDSDEADGSESIDSDEEESDEDVSNKDGFKKGLQKVKDQKDALEAENTLLKERLDALEAKVDKPKEEEVSEKEEAPISQADLTEAIGKFMDEGDSEGIMDVFNYMLDERDKKLVGRYDADQKAKVLKVVERQQEWETIRKEYAPEMYENDELKTNPDFDIGDNKSALYQLSDKIYTEGTNVGKKRYTEKGGMMAAVEDAFLQLVKALGKKKKKPSKKGSDETDGLAQRLTKEQRKKSVNSGKSSLDESSKADTEVTDDLDDYMAERKLDKQKKLGIPI